MAMDSDMMHWHFDYVRLAWDSGFFFGNKKQNEKVDYSMIGLVDIEKISRDRDYATVEKHIATIINFTLEEELSKILEPTFVKLFKLSQLSIEYLQFCKKYLDNTVILLKKELNDRQATCDNLRKDSENTNQYVGNLKKKNKDLKSHLQLLEAQNFDSFDCPHCNKIFSTPAYLESHMNRRHNGPILETPQPTNMQIEADKLQMEIKELKERLNSSEKFTQVEHSAETTTVNKNDIHNKLELHRQHVELELQAIRTANVLKYEQLSETMLKKIEESKNSQIQSPALVVHNNDFAEEVEIINKNLRTTNEESTQTETNIQCADANVNTEAKAFENNEIDVRHQIEGIKNITELHLQEFISVLEQKVSTNLSHLETKLESLLTKCSTVNVASVPKDKIALNKNNEPSPTRQQIMRISKDSHEPKPAPRRQQEIVQSKIVASHIPSVRPQPRSRVLSCTENTMHNVDAGVMKENKPQITFIKSPHAVISSSTSSGSSDSESESDSTSSDDSNNQTEVKPPSKVLKPTNKTSNTSTLKNRSLTSLKKAVDDNVTQGLSAELEAVLNQKLQSLGVSPEWSGIPKQSYEQAMNTINLQSRASSKNYANYSKFRESILLRLKTKLKDILPKKKTISRPRSSRSIQQKSSAEINMKYISRQQQRLASGPSDPIPSISKCPPQAIELLAKQIPMAKTAIFTGKKRVFFDLDTEESTSSVSSIEKQPPPEIQASTLIQSSTVMGSTTSVASSILDGVNKEPEPFYHKNKEKEQNKSDERKNKSAIVEDTSDWDVSDLIA